MTCFHPMTIYVKNNLPINFEKLTEKEQKAIKKVWFKEYPQTYQIQIPCGRCLGCRLDHASMWATRLTMEAKEWKNNWFVTLTYNNGKRKNYNEEEIDKDSLPLTQKGEMTLRKKDVQDFMKRLRKHHEGEIEWINPKTDKKEKPIRYFACGEYGPKGGRPHYHLALFNLKLTDLKPYKKNRQGDWLYTSKELSKIWGNGFVIIGLLQPESASYIARYVQKKSGITAKTRIYKYNDKEQKREVIKIKGRPEEEFLVMSTGVGLGRKYWEEHKEFIKKYQYISMKVGGKVRFKPIPKYFKKLWEKEDWYDYHVVRYERIRKAMEKQIAIMKLENYSGANDEVKWNKHLAKMEEILENKGKYLKRNNFI
nr:MAG TPA: Replication associated protein [Microviridae sp.]